MVVYSRWQNLEKIAVLVDGAQILSFKTLGKLIDPKKLLHVLTEGRKAVIARWYQKVIIPDPRAPLEVKNHIISMITWIVDHVVADNFYDVKISRKDTDSYMVADIYEIVHEKLAEIIVIVSGDGVFTKPARFARRSGIKVEVASTKKWMQPPPLAKSLEQECDRFIELADFEDKILVARATEEGISEIK
jgi:uncharacterized LabA/DUF88 family protein